jgi:hypothetical protein
METSKILIQRLIAPDGKVIAIATSTVTTDSQHPTVAQQKTTLKSTFGNGSSSVSGSASASSL